MGVSVRVRACVWRARKRERTRARERQRAAVWSFTHRVRQWATDDPSHVAQGATSQARTMAV
jgi:hypothetical protein